MKQVVCIQLHEGDEEVPTLEIGSFYTVTEVKRYPAFICNANFMAHGDYYVLAEMGSEFAYHHTHFATLSNIDEKVIHETKTEPLCV